MSSNENESLVDIGDNVEINESDDFHQDINKKVRFLTSLVVWIVGCMLVVPVSVPGIIISVQVSIFGVIFLLSLYRLTVF